MNYLLFIYIFAMFVLFSPSILFKKINKIHALCFSIILYFTYDMVYKKQEYMTSQLKVDANGLQDLVNSLNDEVYEKIINVDVTNEYTISPAKDNSEIVKQCKEKIDEIVGYKTKIEHLTEELSFYEGTQDLIVSLNNTIDNLEKKQDELEKQLKLANDTVIIQKDTIVGKINQIKSLGEQIVGYDSDISGNQVTIKEKNIDIGKLNTTLEKRDSTLNEKLKQISDLLKKVNNKDRTIKEQTDDLNEKNNIIRDQTGQVTLLKDTIGKQKTKINKLKYEYDFNMERIKKNDEFNNTLKELNKKCEKGIPIYNLGDYTVSPWYWNRRGDGGHFNKNGVKSQWIWWDKNARVSAPSNEHKTFSYRWVGKQPANDRHDYTLFIACDNACKVWINDTYIGSYAMKTNIIHTYNKNDSEWKRRFGSRACINTDGENIIKIEAWNSGGPAGLIVMFRRGGTVLFTSNADDKNWTIRSIRPKYVGLGCYKDTGNRALRYGPHRYGYTAEKCREVCPSYKYFALQNGNGTTGWCSCDNDWNHVTKYGAKDCGKTGDGWGNYVYKNNDVS